jgi:hypothetical protein
MKIRKTQAININHHSELTIKKKADGFFVISANNLEAGVELLIPPNELQAFILQNIQYITENLGLTEKQLDFIRAPGLFLITMDDRTLQTLLREVEPDILIRFLWYMKDEQLVKKIVKNCSMTAGELLIEDLELLNRTDPDETTGLFAKAGQDAVKHVIKIYNEILKSM